MNPALNFSKRDGLVPAIVQDHVSGRVLMLGFLNEEVLRRTCDNGGVTFVRRSRQKL